MWATSLLGLLSRISLRGIEEVVNNYWMFIFLHTILVSSRFLCRFSKFGDVAKVEIKSKRDIDGEVSRRVPRRFLNRLT